MDPLSIDTIREVKKLMDKEEELRNYIKALPFNKRSRCPEYLELKDIVHSRHAGFKGTCANCGHGPCHAYAGVGEKVTGQCSNASCDCKKCLCERCDLSWGIDGL
jgi:hypothetical protein